MEHILKQYKLLSCERELKAFIGKRPAVWAVLQEIYPHMIRSYGARPVYLRTNWEDNKLEVLSGVAYPPAQMTECYAKLCTAFYDSIPDRVRSLFTISKL
jgi:hypothetical protein